MLKLWVGGIVEANIADSFRQLRNTLEQTVNTALQAQHYGDALLTWDVVLAVRLSPPPEHVRYNPHTKETDVRVVIDYLNFERASSDDRAGLLADAVLKSLHYLETKSIPDLNLEQLQQDVLGALAKVRRPVI
jgi:hypothetical protein